jgi:hypothetical protein
MQFTIYLPSPLDSVSPADFFDRTVRSLLTRWLSLLFNERTVRSISFRREVVMSISELNFRSPPIHSRNAHIPNRTGAAVIPFQPVGTTEAEPSSSQHAGRSRGADPTSTATVIPFLPPGSSPPVQWVLPRSQSAATSAKRAAQKLITGEEEYRQRMFENLLAAAWVGTLMSAGYYMLNVLGAP